jgi:callose synthase
LHLQIHADIIYSTVQDLGSEHGFQIDNQRNQAEHLLMMLSNECRQGEHILTEPPNRLHSKLFANYKLWCDRVGSPPQFAKRAAGKPYTSQIEDMLLYLLIWGEAANLKHTPECICFLFHKSMLNKVSVGKESLYSGYFLDHVISPVYEVYAKALTSKGDHETKKIYDDFNEFFWSPNCLRYEIVHVMMDSLDSSGEMGLFLAHGLANAPKTYVEKRSYIHGILTFHRVLEWHTLLFTFLATLGMANDLIWTTAYTLQAMSIIFIEINVFGIIWICIEVWLHYSTSNFSNPTVCGYLLRLLVSYVLLVYQTLYFSWSFDELAVGATDDNTYAGSEMRSIGDPSFWWYVYYYTTY